MDEHRTTQTAEETRPRYAFEQFVAIRRYQPALAFSPDGAEVAYVTNTSGQYNLWRQGSDGGYPHQVTTYAEQAVRDVAWSPDGRTIAFLADRQGDEFYQVYAIPVRGGLAQPWTDAQAAQHYLAAEAWSPDGRLLAYCGNGRAPTDQDVLVRDVETGKVRRLLTGDAYYFPIAWSPDGARLTVVAVRSNTNTDVYLVEVADGAVRHVTPHDGEAKYYPGPWAADGSGFYLVSDEGREFAGLAFYDLAEGRLRWVETPEWDVEHVAASRDGRVLVWSVNEDGYSRLHGRDLTTGEPLDLTPVPRGVVDVLAVSPDGAKVGVLLSPTRHPPEIYVANLAGGGVIQLTHGFLGGIDEADLVEPELIRYPTHDGRTIPAFLYRPHGAGPFPLVLEIHGGPEYQERPYYSSLLQNLLNHGIGVLAPNIRGSTGYGKSYQTLIHHDWGGNELKDLEAAALFLRSLDWVDGDRLGVFGGSFGGFATLSCVSRLPDYWAAAVDIVGPSNLLTFAKAVPPTWRRFMAENVGDPETEAEFLLARSPISYVDQITAPLFVIQGANDPRVVRSESDQIVERLRERGVEVRYDVYEDEGHGFTKRENEQRALRDTAAFFEEHLLLNGE